METGEGMVAVVRGLKDAGLAVTLLESGRQYTLLPDTVPHHDVPQVNLSHYVAAPTSQYAAAPTNQYATAPTYQYNAATAPQYAAAPTNQYAPAPTIQYVAAPATQYATSPTTQYGAAPTTQFAVDVSTRRESGVQATDGRYASTYKTTHCHVSPTSPPDLVTEFPPQRAELCPGRENFQIGGPGSGETYCQATRCSTFKGGMCWPDRGSVFAPKPSMKPDPFSSSLRKYPALCRDRSSEIVERLISYTQAKQSAFKNQRSNVSPTRNVIESDVSNQTIGVDSSSRNSNSAKYPRQYEPEANRTKRLEESPTRERPKRGPIDQECLESWRRPTFCRTNDVRYLRDVSRKVRDGIRSLSHQPNCQPEKLNNTKEKCESNTTDRRMDIQLNTNSVNMEIQAAVQMVSREVVTAPIAAASQRTIAVQLTPSPSRAEPNSKDVSSLTSKIAMVQQSEVDQTDITTAIPSRELQSALSAIEISDNKLIKYRGSKSQEDIRMLQNEILVIRDFHLRPYGSKFHRRSHSRINKSNKFLVKLARNYNSVSKQDSKYYERKYSHLANSSKELTRFQSYARIFHAEVTPYRISGEEDLAEIIEDWLDLIPLKQEETHGRNFDKELMFYDFFDCLKFFVGNPMESSRRYKLKSDILDRLDNVPIEIKGNRRAVLSRLADILINKIKNIACKKSIGNADTSRREIKAFKDICSSTSEGYVPPTESELKIFISSELIFYLEKASLKLNRRKTKDLEDDLLDCFMFFIEEMRFGSDKRVRKSVIKMLGEYGFTEHQATHFANLLLTNLKESFLSESPTPKVRSETFIVLPNIQNADSSRKSTAHKSKLSIAGNKCKTKNKIDLESYTNELCRQIDLWLSSLQIEIPANTENGLKQVIINDLAGDIIDRYKYLELNPICRGSDEAELELLRYQIFKWIGKLVGEDNFVPKDHAPELMMRIRELPMFDSSCDKINSYQATNSHNACKRSLLSGSRSDINMKMNNSSPKLKHEPDTNMKHQNEKIKNVSVSTSSRDFDVMTMAHAGTSSKPFRGSDIKIRCNQNSKAACCIQESVPNSNQSVKSVEQLEAEYQQFVKDWVQQVPIKISSPDQEAVVERARVELHNGLWKIVSKLNCDPATYYNRFFYEDLLDDAIEDLLDCLPQTPEMISRRHSLKLEFIEKTVSVYDHIRAHEDASFKNKLVKNVITNLRTHGIIDNEREESIKQHEDLQIIKLVEEYLLYTRFKNDNKLISDVFKKKLTTEIGDFVEDLKKNHNREFRNIDTSSYKAEIMNALEKVPLPCERTIVEEADNILLGIEVEQWYTDLPIVHKEDSINTYHKKRQLDFLIMKIKEIENNDSADESETALRNEIIKFLEKMPLKEGERLNTNFMADELVNRVKHMRKQDTSQSTKRVLFKAPDTYEEFGDNIPFASSYIETSPFYGNPATENDLTDNRFNQTSKFDKTCTAQHITPNGHKKGNIENSPQQSTPLIKEPSNYRAFGEEPPTNSSVDETSNRWYTLKDRPAHIPRHVPNNTQHYSIPNTSFTPQEFQQDISLDSVENKAINQYYNPNINYQRGILGNSQTQPSFLNKDDRNRSFEDTSSVQYKPQGIKTSKGILGISQVAGPSGYRQNQLESPQAYLPSSRQIPNSNIHSTDDRRYNVTNQSGNEQTRDDRELNQTNKCSIGCQSFRNDGIERPREILENETERTFDTTKNSSVATNTSTGRIPSSDFGQPNYASTPKQNTSSKPNVSKKRPKWATPEKQGSKPRFNDTDDDDEDYHCRCIERYWRCRRRPKHISSEEFGDYPPCMPMLFPYPCFL